MGTINAGIPDTLITLFLIMNCNKQNLGTSWNNLGMLCMGPQTALVSRMGMAWEKMFNLGTSKEPMSTCLDICSAWSFFPLSPTKYRQWCLSKVIKNIGLLPRLLCGAVYSHPLNHWEYLNGIIVSTSPFCAVIHAFLAWPLSTPFPLPCWLSHCRVCVYW